MNFNQQRTGTTATTATTGMTAMTVTTAPTTSPMALPSPHLTEPAVSPKNPGHSPVFRTTDSLTITEYSNPVNRAMKKRCRTVMTPYQSRVLRRVLEQTAFPSTEVRENLARILGMRPRTVQIWFQNQRQKSRQSVVSDRGVGAASSPDSSCESTVSLSPPSDTDAVSPDFAALSVAAAMANGTMPAGGIGANDRWSRFHGPVFKTLPGSISLHGGNTAAAVNYKRNAAAAARTSSPDCGATGNGRPDFSTMSHGRLVASSPAMPLVPGFNGLPAQPLLIPSCPVLSPLLSLPHQRPAAVASPEVRPLDILASAVSNFRPGGYNYYMNVPGASSASPPVVPQHFMQNRSQTPEWRLPPLRTPSPPNLDRFMDPNQRLPSLKTLAQVASIGMELEVQRQQRQAQMQMHMRMSQLNKPVTVAKETTTQPVPSAPQSIPNSRRPW